jgi:hypothetical protein
MQIYVVKVKTMTAVYQQADGKGHLMSGALTQLKAFIQTYLLLQPEPFPEAVTEEIKAFVSESMSSLQLQIDEVIWNTKEESLRVQYVRDIQLQLTSLGDELTGTGLSENQTLRLGETIDWVLMKIFQALDHLRTYFSLYFNFGAALPVQFIQKYEASHRFQVEALLKSIKEKGVDQDLLALLENYFHAHYEPERSGIRTWSQWDYLLSLQAGLIDLNQMLPKGDITFELLKFLIKRDFNSADIYAYFMKYFERITSSELSLQEQQEALFYQLKIFRQIRIEVSSSFDPGAQPLKTSLSDCLLAELDYVAQKEKIFLQHFESPSSGKTSRFYFDVTFTLPELMFFCRLMIETDALRTKFNSHLYEFIAAHIRTQRAENLSKKSMRNHFSNRPFPDRIVRKVREWLGKMIAHIDLYYKDQA